jgi:hypothetical protein
VALFCFAVAVKWWVIGWVGSDLPWIDQWGPEAELYRRWLSGALRWSDFFLPANEHRIVFTHLLNLGLLRLNGQWDPLLQMTVNAVLNAAGLTFLAWWLGRELPSGWRGFLLLLVVAGFVVPFGIQNLVWGFQSQVYFTVLFSLLALYFVTEFRPEAWRWWLGVVMAFAAYCAMAPGALVGLVLVGWAMFRSLEQRRLQWAMLPHVTLGLVLVLLAWCLRQEVPRHAAVGIQVQSWERFTQVFTSALSWPVCDPRLFLPMNLPLLLLSLGRLWRRIPVRPNGDRALLVAAWVLGVAGTFAFYRGGIQDPHEAPQPRYADFLALLPVANALALMEIVPLWHGRRWMGWGSVAAWLALLLWGGGGLLWTTMDSMREHARIKHTLAFDVLNLRATRERGPTLVFSVDGCIHDCERRLADPLFAPIWPPVLQKELPITWPEENGLLRLGGFDPRLGMPWSLTVWGTRSEDGLPRTGTEQSEPFFCTGPAVEVLAAFTARPGMAEIVFVSENSGERIALACDSVPRGEWVKLAARLPAGQYRLEITSTDPRGWVAVSAPRKLAWLGYWVRWLLAYRTLWLQLATGGSVLVLVGLWRTRDSTICSARA